MPDTRPTFQTAQITDASPSRTLDTQARYDRSPGLGVAPVDRRDAWVISLQGEIDAAAVTCLQRQVTDALTGYDRVVLELDDVSVLSTPTLALLCGALRRAHRPGATLVIADAAPAAHHALRLC